MVDCRVFWICTIAIFGSWKTTITIRLIGTIPLQFHATLKNTTEYVLERLGPICKRIRCCRICVWTSLPLGQEDKVLTLCHHSSSVRFSSTSPRPSHCSQTPPTSSSPQPHTPPALGHGHLNFELRTAGEESPLHRLPPVHGAGGEVQEQERQLLLQVLKWMW